MAEQRALSRHQFAESGFDSTGYAFNEEQGLHTGTIDCKRWGKQKLVTYFTLDDGRKVVAPTWPKSNYLGLAELPVGSITAIVGAPYFIFLLLTNRRLSAR